MHTLRRGLRLVVFIGVPASVGLMLVAKPLTATIYLGGRCGPDEVSRIAHVLMAFAPAVAACSAIQLLTRAFYALGDQRTPTRVSLMMVGLNVLLNVTLIWTPLNLSGLAWSTTVCAFIQCWLLSRTLHRRLGHLMDAVVWKSLGKTLLSTAAMAVVIVGIDMALPFGDEWWGMFCRLGILVGVGIGGLFLAASRLHMPERRWAIGMADTESLPSASAD